MLSTAEPKGEVSRDTKVCMCSVVCVGAHVGACACACVCACGCVRARVCVYAFVRT